MWIFCLVWHVKVEWIANWFLCIVTFNNHIAAHWIEVIWCSSFVILNKIDWYIENEFFSCSYCDVILNILCNEFMLFPIVKGWIDNGIYITSHISIWDIENADFEIYVEAIVITTVLFDGDTDGLSFWFSCLYEVCHHYWSIKLDKNTHAKLLVLDEYHFDSLMKAKFEPLGHEKFLVRISPGDRVFWFQRYQNFRFRSLKNREIIDLKIHIFEPCIFKSMISQYSKLRNFDILRTRRSSCHLDAKNKFWKVFDFKRNSHQAYVSLLPDRLWM